MTKRNYFRRLVDENDPASIKRFTVLAVLAHFIITGYVALFMSKSLANVALVTTIMEYNFGLTVESVYQILLKKAEVMVNAAPPITVENAEKVTSSSTNTKANVVNAEQVDTVNTQNTSINNQKIDNPDG